MVLSTYFLNTEIYFKPEKKRQTIVDSWAADMDDSAARRDWGWMPEYDVHRAFKEYLVPNIKKHYQ